MRRKISQTINRPQKRDTSSQSNLEVLMNNHTKIISISWFGVFGFIPVLSANGRQWQYFVFEYLDRTSVGVVFGVATLILGWLVGRWLLRRGGRWALLPLLGAGIVAAGIFASVPPGERWFHVPLFGVFGFLSVRVFGFMPGLLVALAAAGFDEVWQHYLPDRHGSPVDVGINAAAALAGVAVAIPEWFVRMVGRGN